MISDFQSSKKVAGYRLRKAARLPLQAHRRGREALKRRARKERVAVEFEVRRVNRIEVLFVLIRARKQ